MDLQQVCDFIQLEVDDLENEISALTKVKKKYNIRHRVNPMDIYDEKEFRRRFRLSKDSVRYLYDLIGKDLEPLVTRAKFTITGLNKILITLRYYATASFQMVGADLFGVSEASICKIIPEVSDKIAALSTRFIQMPSTSEEIQKAKKEFFRVAQMPCVIGVIDGTLIKIQEVGGAQNKTDFFCRKQFYAINCQVTTDADCKIIDISARWPGSVHDQIVWLNSRLFQRFLSGEFAKNQQNSILLGDGGYGSEPFLATPLRETQRVRSRAETLYQEAHISTRNIVERFFGQWKKRFPILFVGMRFRKLDTVLDVIVATAVLHNICKRRGDLLPPSLSPSEEQLYNAAIQQEREIVTNNNIRNARRLPHTIANAVLRHHFENIAQQ